MTSTLKRDAARNPTFETVILQPSNAVNESSFSLNHGADVESDASHDPGTERYEDVVAAILDGVEARNEEMVDTMLKFAGMAMEQDKALKHLKGFFAMQKSRGLSLSVP